MATVYGVTENGFVRKPIETIVESLNNRFKGEFGANFDVSPESPDGQVIGIVANEISDCWGEAENAFNGYRPGAMEGVGLDNICELTGTVRYVDRHTQVTVELSGSSGTVVPAGSIVSDGSMDFVTDIDTTIPGDVTAVATESGEYFVAKNTVTVIRTTGISGWSGVNNPEDGLTGVTYEQDPALRARRDRTTALAGSATVESIYAALADLSLTYIRIRDNDTNAAIGTQPAGTIWVVVDGGTKNDIAKRIYNSKTGGVPTFGSESVSITDSKGYPHVIKFSRSSPQPIYVKGSFRRRSGANISSNDAVTMLQDAVVNYLNSLPPGGSVVWASLFSPLMAAVANIEIVSLFIGISANPTGTATIDLDIDKRAQGLDANVTFTDVTS